MIGIHPKIYPFWLRVKGGYAINQPPNALIWEHIKKGWVPVDMAFIYKDKPTRYYFMGEWYSEQEMLRIVGLKAFL